LAGPAERETYTPSTTDAEHEPIAPDGPAPGGWLTRLSRELPVIVPPLIWLALGWQRRWITDDGLIAARTVRQILAGNGPVFNAGERVEANTSALWTWLLVAVTWITHSNVYAVMVDTGLVLAPLGLLFAMLGARNLHRRTSAGGLYLPAGAVVVLALPPFWDFATSGLEDPLIFFWLGLSWWLLTGLTRDSGRRAAFSFFVAGLSWLVRPDLALAGVLFLCATWYIVRPGWRLTAALLALGGFVPVAYEIFRMGYYGLLVPNTALAKEASTTHYSVGWAYLQNFVGPYDLWVPLGVLALLVPLTVDGRRLDRAARILCAAAVLGALLMGGYVVAIGGDFMHARMLLPAVFILLLPVMVLPAPRLAAATSRLTRLVPASFCLIALFAWGFTCATSWRLPQAPGRIPGNGITDERAFWAFRVGEPNPDLGLEYQDVVFGPPGKRGSLSWKIIQDAGSGKSVLLFIPPGGTQLVAVPLAEPGHSVAVPSEILGTLGVAVPLNGLAIDVHGLSYALGSHLRPGPDGRIGHEKYAAPVWIVAEYTTAASVPGIPAADVAAARRALACGGLADLQQATEAPMSWNRFWSNVVGASRLTRVRVPDDPYQADAQLCR
jgi:arabinofuranosyltransferase